MKYLFPFPCAEEFIGTFQAKMLPYSLDKNIIYKFILSALTTTVFLSR